MSENAAPDAGQLADNAAPSLLTDINFLQELRQQMYRFARLQLDDNQLAEDAVQEALLGALKNARTFAGQAALKTWVFAILKNKIADILRQRQRFVDADRLGDSDTDEEILDSLFNEHGAWHRHERPVHWENPESAIHDKHFWRVFEACLERLPARQARIFMMREFIELETHEICAAVGITVSNLNVILHRARLRLRDCLENNWFAREG